MNNIIFFDFNRENLLPLTFTRPVGDLRCGTLTFAQRWSGLLNTNFSFLTEDYLQEKYPLKIHETSLFINPCIFPTYELLDSIKKLKINQGLFYGKVLIACNSNYQNFKDKKIEKITYLLNLDIIKYPWDLFSINYKALKFDFELITKNRTSQKLSLTNGILGDKKLIFLEEKVDAEFCTFNVKEGPIYIGKNVKISEGSHLRGPLSIGNDSIINMGTKIHGGTTIGPVCKIGGEINNVVIWGYSSKGHEGYLGNSVIGQWCNLGADTNTSNLKNNYDIVKCWSYKNMKFISTKLQFCGTIMGDHSKTAINTQLNTGTIIGVFANIFVYGFPPNIIHNFAWGGERGTPKFRLDKAHEIASRVMKRRLIKFNDIEKNIISYLFNQY